MTLGRVHDVDRRDAASEDPRHPAFEDSEEIDPVADEKIVRSEEGAREDRDDIQPRFLDITQDNFLGGQFGIKVAKADLFLPAARRRQADLFGEAQDFFRRSKRVKTGVILVGVGVLDVADASRRIGDSQRIDRARMTDAADRGRPATSLEQIPRAFDIDSPLEALQTGVEGRKACHVKDVFDAIDGPLHVFDREDISRPEVKPRKVTEGFRRRPGQIENAKGLWVALEIENQMMG